MRVNPEEGSAYKEANEAKRESRQGTKKQSRTERSEDARLWALGRNVVLMRVVGLCLEELLRERAASWAEKGRSGFNPGKLRCFLPWSWLPFPVLAWRRIQQHCEPRFLRWALVHHNVPSRFFRRFCTFPTFPSLRRQSEILLLPQLHHRSASRRPVTLAPNSHLSWQRASAAPIGQAAHSCVAHRC